MRDAIIGDRALGADPMHVAALGPAVIDGLREGGVVGVVKHMPGHGRAMVDSHKELPVVDASEAELRGRSRRSRSAQRRADGDDRARRLYGLGQRALRAACRRS